MKNKAKKEYWASLDLLRDARQIPPPPDNPPEHARVEVEYYLWAPMDDGNAMNRLKWVEDWLVANGYLLDDSKKHLTYSGFPTQQIDRKNQRVVITLTPLEQ